MALQSGWLGPVGSGSFGFMDRNPLFDAKVPRLDSVFVTNSSNPASPSFYKGAFGVSLMQSREWGYSEQNILNAWMPYRRWVFELGWNHQQVKSYEATDASDNSLGSSFQPYAMDPSLGVSWNNGLDLALGLRAHLPMERVADFSEDQLGWGLGLDLGAIYQPNSRRSYHASVRHLGQSYEAYVVGGEVNRSMDSRFEIGTKWRSPRSPRWTLGLGLEGGFYREANLLFDADYRLGQGLSFGLSAPLFHSDVSEFIGWAVERTDPVWEQDALAIGRVQLSRWGFNLTWMNQVNRYSRWSSGLFLSYSPAKPEPQKPFVPVIQDLRDSVMVETPKTEMPVIDSLAQGKAKSDSVLPVQKTDTTGASQKTSGVPVVQEAQEVLE